MLNDTATVEQYTNYLKSAEQTLENIKDELFTNRENEFLASGGCVSCWGQGTVCVWATLDSVTGGYDQFDTCPDCDGKRQPWYGANKRRRLQHPKLSNLPSLARTDSEKEDLDHAERSVKTAKKMLEDCKERWEVIKGSVVEVVRGRKTPKGTIGTVFWIGEGEVGRGYYQRYVTKAGIKTSDGVTHWVNNIEYLKLLKPRTQIELYAARSGAKHAQGVRYLVRKGSQIVSQRVTGTVTWAGCTKRGNGPWRALVKAKEQDFWLDASEITLIGGVSVSDALAK